jgi:hypothetical protein
MTDAPRQEIRDLVHEWEMQEEVRLGVQQRHALVERIYAFGMGITESAWRRTKTPAFLIMKVLCAMLTADEIPLDEAKAIAQEALRVMAEPAEP